MISRSSGLLSAIISVTATSVALASRNTPSADLSRLFRSRKQMKRGGGDAFVAVHE